MSAIHTAPWRCPKCGMLNDLVGEFSAAGYCQNIEACARGPQREPECPPVTVLAPLTSVPHETAAVSPGPLLVTSYEADESLSPRLAALRTVVKIAEEDEDACADAELFQDAETAHKAAAWARGMIQEIEEEAKR